MPIEVGFLPQLANTLAKLNHGRLPFVNSLTTKLAPTDGENRLLPILGSKVEYQSLRTANVTLAHLFHSRSPDANNEFTLEAWRVFPTVGTAAEFAIEYKFGMFKPFTVLAELSLYKVLITLPPPVTLNASLLLM